MTSAVMAGLVPAIHDLLVEQPSKTWMPATSAGMTTVCACMGDVMTARPQTKLAMRPMLPDDVPLLAEIFRASIEELSADDYSEAQQEAWASAADDEEEFGARLARRADAGRDLRRLCARLCFARRQ